MILIAYDGSDDAKAAIQHAGELMPGQPAVVVTVWEPYVHMLTRYPASGAILAGEDSVEIDDATRTAAEEKAEEGAGLARQHADRVVVVVPSPKIAQKRNEKLRTYAEASG